MIAPYIPKPGRCACGEVFIGPRNQKRCAECAEAYKRAYHRRWGRRRTLRLQRQRRKAAA